MAAQLRLSRYYPLLKHLLEAMVDSHSAEHACMLALCYMEISVAEMEMDDYAAARSHLEAGFQQLDVDYTLQEPLQEENDVVVAEAFLYYAVCLDNLPRDRQQTQLALSCLEKSREMFARWADAAEAAGGAEAQGQQVSLRSQEASVLMQLSLHWFGHWKEISSNIVCTSISGNGSSARNSPAVAAADITASAEAAFNNALALQSTCIKLRQLETLNMSTALLHHSNLLAAVGDVMRALEAARKADSIRRAALGHEHRQTLQSTMHVAKLYASELHDHRCTGVVAGMCGSCG
jgi:tetratricopeptide (TPR) repeat protein